MDLACGRGGYGLKIAARTGATLVGVDFSAEAVQQASEHARRHGRSVDFRLGDLAATGLEPVMPGDERLSERMPCVDLRAGLTAAGLDNVETRDRPGCHAAERAMWEGAAAIDLRE